MGKIIEKIDARTQSRAELQERRVEVIRLHQDGVPVMQIVEQMGMSWAAVNAAITKYKAEGEAALMPTARGRKQGSGRKLSADQEAEICRLIYTKRPNNFQLNKILWDRDAVMQLIEQRLGIVLSVRSVGDYLKRWGLTLKYADKSPQQRCAKEIRNWLDANYSGIEHQAKSDGAEIYWIKKPQPIALPTNGSDNTIQDGAVVKLSMVSVVNNQGKVSWMINKGRFNPIRQIMFAKALIKDTKGESRKKVFLIRSHADVFSSRDVTDWANTNKEQIKIFPDHKDDIQIKAES
jgi:transposase